MIVSKPAALHALRFGGWMCMYGPPRPPSCIVQTSPLKSHDR